MQAIDTSARSSIRPYRSGDRNDVIRMLAESDPWKTLGYTAAQWERLFDPLPAGRDGYVIELNGTVAGIGLLRPRFLFGDYLELLAIAPSAQGKGLGTTLLLYLERVVFQHGQNLFVCVSDFNTAARRFYTRNGYEEVGPLPDLLIAGATEILLRKTTGPARGDK
jgi:ribosomal protein S18 acetylase RimI-like enzyme